MLNEDVSVRTAPRKTVGKNKNQECSYFFFFLNLVLLSQMIINSVYRHENDTLLTARSHFRITYVRNMRVVVTAL